jgi:anaphase-promoting complex subunit 10
MRLVEMADSEDEYDDAAFNNEINSVEEEEEDDDEEEEDDEEEDDEEDGEEEEEEDGGTQNNSSIVHATTTLTSLSDPDRALKVREIGNDAVWSLSTAKPGNGVTQIRDSSADTYWQSDGGQPHLINIHFLKRKSVCEIAFYLDYSQDESYTPKKISIRAGITFHDLEEIKEVELNEPVGWVSVPLYAEPDPLDEDDDNDVDMDMNSESRNRRRKPVRTYLLQVCVVSMHQNGRDTHVRQVKIFGPRSEAEFAMRRTPMAFGVPTFQSVGMSQFSTIR